jgi:hypothetical protein
VHVFSCIWPWNVGQMSWSTTQSVSAKECIPKGCVINLEEFRSEVLSEPRTQEAYARVLRPAAASR